MLWSRRRTTQDMGIDAVGAIGAIGARIRGGGVHMCRREACHEDGERKSEDPTREVFE